MKTLTSAAAYGLVPVPVPREGHACPDKDDQLPRRPKTRTPHFSHGTDT
jgi:hypothetical protein